jgi:hypothetical protein
MAAERVNRWLVATYAREPTPAPRNRSLKDSEGSDAVANDGSTWHVRSALPVDVRKN